MAGKWVFRKNTAFTLPVNLQLFRQYQWGEQE